MTTEAPVCLASLIISKLKSRRNERETICEHYDNKENRFVDTEGRAPQVVTLSNTAVCLKHL
jgi:hypothetical protein